MTTGTTLDLERDALAHLFYGMGDIFGDQAVAQPGLAAAHGRASQSDLAVPHLTPVPTG